MIANDHEIIDNKFVKKKWITMVYSLLIALLPVLSVYYSGIPGTNIADILLMAFWLMTFVFVMLGHINVRLLWKSYSSSQMLLFAFCAYSLVLILVGFIKEDPQLIVIFVRTSRITFYLCSVIVLSTLFVDIVVLKKAIRIISVLGSLFIIYQVIAYRTTGNVVKGFVSFIPLYSPEYADLDYNSFYAYEYQRPTSFFLEPAHFSRFALFGLTFCLFGQQNIRIKLPDIAAAILITTGIVLSTSGIGIVYSAIVWAIYIAYIVLRMLKEGKFRLLAISIIILSTTLAFLYVVSPTLRFVISRTTNLRHGSAFSARLGSMQDLLEFESIIELFFGHGYGAIPAVGTWMSGLTYVLYGTGVVGFGILFASLFIMFLNRKTNLARRIVVMLVALLMIVDDSFNSVIVVFLYTLMLHNGERALCPRLKLA